MSKPAIVVDQIAKEYRLGEREAANRTFREALTDTAAAPLRRLRRSRSGAEDAAAVGSFWALKDVSFEVQQGEVVGIIGRNGAGKSTLLKILSRITEPTSGRIRLRGRVASLLEVGTGFHPELTGRENVFLNGAILGMSRREIERQFDEIVAFAEVGKFIDTPVKRYSSGMYLRLAFAVAAHLEPELLIVDEVLAVGDAEFQRKCIGKMGEVAKSGRTVLFVSHNMPAVQSLCSTALWLQDGEVAECGDVAKVVTSYLRGRGEPAAVLGLMDHPGRVQGSVAIFNRIELQDERGEANTTFQMGAPMRVCLDLAPTTPISQPAIGIGVNNSLGQRVFTVGTRYSRNQINRIADPTRLECEIPSLALMPGRYFVKIAVGNGLTDLDTIEDAIAFDVAASDFYGTGAIPNAAQGVVVQPSFWGHKC